MKTLSFLAVLVFCSTFFSPLNAESPDYSDGISGAKSIQLNTPTNGRISYKRDSDYFQIVLTSSIQIIIETFIQENKSDMDTELRLYNSAGRLIASNNNISRRNKFSALAGTLPAGTYYIEVHSNEDKSTGDYTLNYGEQLSYANDRDFSLYRKDNIIGNLQVIGNSVKLDSVNGGQCAPNGTDNNDLTATYADVDNDPSTYNSTSANLVLPANVKSENILYASLYWQGRVSGTSTLVIGKSVKIKPYGQTAYTTISSISSKFNWSGFDYQGIADVTDVIKTSVDDRNATAGYNEPVFVADVYAPLNDNGFGAWTLVVVYEDSTSVLRNISTYDGYKHVYENTITTTLDGFLTPTSGKVDSSFYVFAGEGDVNLTDKVTLTDVNNVDQALGNNIFKSSIDQDGVSVTNRDPACTNTIGADIRSFSVGTKALIPIIGNNQTKTTIKLTSTGDEFVPGFFAFSTQLYEPRVCYFIDTIVDSSGANVFEDRKFVKPITSGEKYTFKFWISNMKKFPTDPPLEVARLVQVYLGMTNFNYFANTTVAQNIGATIFTPLTDAIDSDIGEYSANNATWRVGLGADNLQGGTLEPTAIFKDDTKKAFFNLEASMTISGDATNINLLDFLEFKASFQTDSITIGADNAQILSQCVDINSSGSVAAPIGSYNAVQTTFTGTNIPNDPLAANDPINRLPTQVANRPFTLTIISLATDNLTLSASAGDVNVSIINTPLFSSQNTPAINQALCDNAVPIAQSTVEAPSGSGTVSQFVARLPLTGLTRNNVTLNSVSATRSASVKITSFIDGSSACSRDVFAIRPDRFLITLPAGQDINLLTSALNYNFKLTAEQASNISPTNGYNVTNAATALSNPQSLDNDKIIFNPDSTDGTSTLNGILSYSADFNVTDGLANPVAISFTDVGLVQIRVIDRNWAAVDVNNNDTLPNCSASGAYVCGNINATFIPDHFRLAVAHLFNDNNSTFTYVSNNLLRVSASLGVTITAENNSNNATINFDSASWQNPVDVNLTIANVPGMATNKNEISTNDNITFTGGVRRILFNEANPLFNLLFNFTRANNVPINPFVVNGSDVNITAFSHYVAPSGKDANVTGVITADQNATFLYGRTHATRQRFSDANGTVTVYYETYCSGINGNRVCDKTLLPNDVNSTISDDPRWFINTLHAPATDGVVSITATTITDKNTNKAVTTIGFTRANPESVSITYDESRGYPYKTTMINTPDSWLIYNQYNVNAVANEFQVEFTNSNNAWAGHSETKNTTNTNAADRTNRRSMW